MAESSRMRMPYPAALQALGRRRRDELVVTTMTSSRVWAHVTERPELDLSFGGCMGKASSLGLGLALGRPERRVWVLDGDGSLVMNLGTLVTMAQRRAPSPAARRAPRARRWPSSAICWPPNAVVMGDQKRGDLATMTVRRNQPGSRVATRADSSGIGIRLGRMMEARSDRRREQARSRGRGSGSGAQVLDR